MGAWRISHRISEKLKKRTCADRWENGRSMKMEGSYLSPINWILVWACEKIEINPPPPFRKPPELAHGDSGQCLRQQCLQRWFHDLHLGLCGILQPGRKRTNLAVCYCRSMEH